MNVRFTLEGVIEVPEGCRIEGRTIHLPSGDVIKLWTAVELNEEFDLNRYDREARGIFLDYEEVATIEET